MPPAPTDAGPAWYRDEALLTAHLLERDTCAWNYGLRIAGPHVPRGPCGVRNGTEIPHACCGHGCTGLERETKRVR